MKRKKWEKQVAFPKNPFHGVGAGQMNEQFNLHVIQVRGSASSYSSHMHSSDPGSGLAHCSMAYSSHVPVVSLQEQQDVVLQLWLPPLLSPRGSSGHVCPLFSGFSFSAMACSIPTKAKPMTNANTIPFFNFSHSSTSPSCRIGLRH